MTIFFFLPVINGGNIIIPEDTPVFVSPDCKPGSRPVLILPRTLELKNPESRIYVYKKHPVARYFTFYKLPVKPEAPMWASPQLAADPEKVQLYFPSTPYLPRLYFSIVSGLLLVIVIGLLVIRWRQKSCFDRWNILLLCMIILFLRWFMLSLFWYNVGNVMTAAMDENSYFKVGYDLSHGVVAGQKWLYTIGTGALYGIFIRLGGYQDVSQIIQPLSVFNGYVIMPACLILMFLIMIRLKMKEVLAFAVILFLSLTQFYYTHIEDWTGQIFKACFVWPGTGMSFRTYRNFILLGFNAMSDLLSMFLMLVVFYCGLVLPRKNISLVILVILFACACLVRLNNAVFAPFVAWIIYMGYKENLKTLKHALLPAVITLISFFAVFSLQLMVNYIQLGSPFKTPYSLHAQISPTVLEWRYVPQNIRYLVGGNYVYMMPGAVGMLFMKPGNARKLLVLWSVPLILFFLGYCVTYADVSRFIYASFGLLLAAFVLASERCVPEQYRKFFYPLVIINMLLLSPQAYFDPRLMAWGLSFIQSGVIINKILCFSVPLLTLLTLVVIWLKGKGGIPWFIICFFGIFYTGWAPLTILIMVFCLGRTLFECGREMAVYWFLKPALQSE